MRDREFARDQDNPHTPLQLYSVCLWARSRRSVSIFPQVSVTTDNMFRAYELQEPSSIFYSASTRSTLTSRLNTLTSNVYSELKRQGFIPSRIKVERMLNMRFEGTDTSLMVLPQDGDGDGEEDFEAAFRRVYKAEFGFLLEGQSVSVDDIKVGSARNLQ